MLFFLSRFVFMAFFFLQFSIRFAFLLFTLASLLLFFLSNDKPLVNHHNMYM